MLDKNEMKKLKRSSNYTYVKNYDYKEQTKKDFNIIVKKTEEIKKIVKST